MKKKLALNQLEVFSFVTDVKEVKSKGGDDTYRLQCTAQACTAYMCTNGYCPGDPNPTAVTEFDSVCIPLTNPENNLR